MNKIGNVFFVYDLDARPRNPTSNSIFKNCLLFAPSIPKNSDKEKYMYSAYRLTFYDEDSWGFDDDTSRNVITFGVENSSSSHADNHKNIFLLLGEGLAFGINWRFGSPEKKVSKSKSKHKKFP